MILIRITREDLKVVLRDLGAIVFIIGYTLLIPLIVALFYGEENLYFAFLYPSAFAIWIGFFLKRLFAKAEETRTKHAIIVAGLAWLVVSLIGSFPFQYYGVGVLDSYFETMSGFTTSGLTLFQDVEVLPNSLLFWRAFIQWIGGVGVITLFLAVLFQRGSVAARFYAAEASGERISPSITKTINYIWRVYIVYTIIGIILYYIVGMDLFDAASHTFTALATAGFSTKNASIGAYNSLPIEAVTVLLMFLGGTSFLILYRLLRGEKTRFLGNPELRAYVGFISVSALFISINLVRNGHQGIEAVRWAVFHSVSAITTTGFSTSDLAAWPDFSKAILLFLMISGGSMGSTAGGLKILRSLILVKLSYQEIVRALIPERAVLSFKIKDKVLENEEVLRVASFFFLYIAFVFTSGLVITTFGYDFFGAMFTVSSAQGNVGLLSVPSAVWYSTPDPAKIILIANMWIGRLEIFPALALLGSIFESLRRPKPST
ncbi:MAG: TrkH family potassium uptake protein [Candidatus Hydrothermarchaeaceae archaeon]